MMNFDTIRLVMIHFTPIDPLETFFLCILLISICFRVV